MLRLRSSSLDRVGEPRSMVSASARPSWLARRFRRHMSGYCATGSWADRHVPRITSSGDHMAHRAVDEELPPLSVTAAATVGLRRPLPPSWPLCGPFHTTRWFGSARARSPRRVDARPDVTLHAHRLSAWSTYLVRTLYSDLRAADQAYFALNERRGSNAANCPGEQPRGNSERVADAECNRSSIELPVGE